MIDLTTAAYCVMGILALSVGSLLKIAWDAYIVKRNKREQGNRFEI